MIEKMARVLLVGIYDTNTAALAPEMLRSYVSQFPIAARYEIQTLNLSIFSQSIGEMVEQIRQEQADVVGFSAYIWNIQAVRKIVQQIDGTIILGGPHCNEDAERLLRENPAVDVVVSGEGEETFKELLEHFDGRRSLESIAGITWRHGKTLPRTTLLDVDSVPSPYPRIFREHPHLEWIAYETSRGCPFLCGFCTWGYSKKMRYHRLERVFSDLDTLLSQPSLRRIYLCDSSILLQKERAKAILQHIIRKNREMVLRYEFNAEHLDDEIIDLLLQLPENEFNFGVQTTNRRALHLMRRPFHRDKFEENYHKMVRRTERTSITMDVIYGLPGDDLEGFEDSLDYTMSFDQVKWILTNPLILLPGADFYRDSEKHGIRVRDDESCIVESTASFSAEEMREAVKISFWVSTVFFNGRLRDSMRAFARARRVRFIDDVIDFFSSLPFPLISGDSYPYMVPSVAADFRARNLAVFRVLHLYPHIVRYFDQITEGQFAAELADFESHFVDQFHRLSRFALDEAAQCGLLAPATPTWAPRPPPWLERRSQGIDALGDRPAPRSHSADDLLQIGRQRSGVTPST